LSAVVFETPDLIDVRAFTIMGAHAKPNSANPIGFFGTGLKYAIAVLVRLGCEPVVWVGRDKLSFSKKVAKFRGTDLETIVMRVHKDGNKRPTSYELPFTTRYGANWKPWMAFRELESNTRDEGGRTFLIDRPELWTADYGGPDARKTFVIVDLPAFVEAAEKIDEVFLPRARREGTLLEAIDPNDRPEEREAHPIYYRTMRAMTVDKPTIYTYNVLESVELTEDRTITYSFRVRDVLARWVLTEATEAQVEAIVTADDGWWEHGLEFPGHVAPSAAFRAVMLRRPKGTSSRARGYWSTWSSPAPIVRAQAFVLFEAAPKPWKVDDDAVFDAGGEPVFERPKGMGWREWVRIAGAIVAKLDAAPSTEEPESEDDEEEPDEEDEGDPAEPLDAEETEPAS
jgi:hypothetical protein